MTDDGQDEALRHAAGNPGNLQLEIDKSRAENKQYTSSANTADLRQLLQHESVVFKKEAIIHRC